MAVSHHPHRALSLRWLSFLFSLPVCKYSTIGLLGDFNNLLQGCRKLYGIGRQISRSKPYRNCFSEKYHTGLLRDQQRLQRVGLPDYLNFSAIALSRGVKNRSSGGLRTDPLGSSQRCPCPLAGLGEGTLRTGKSQKRKGKKRKEKGREGGEGRDKVPYRQLFSPSLPAVLC